jgi:hypothetical protein
VPPMSILSSLARLLRSRKLAVALIAVTAAYAFLGTVIPQGSPDDPRVRAWADERPSIAAVVAPLGLNAAYSTPLFLGLAALLTLATGACAWERTAHALRLRRRMGAATPAQIERLKARPQLAMAVAKGVPGDAALDAASARLRRAGLRVGRSADGLDAVAGAWTAFGSTVFHWALVALALTLAVGQATRAEGALDLPIGVPAIDARASYIAVEAGPLFGERFTGLEIVASDLVHNFGADGINRGPAPVITLRRGATAVASGRVYPNSPLRYGPLLIHMVEYGLAPAIALEDADGAVQGGQGFMLAFSRETSSGTVAQQVEASRGPSLPPVAMRVEVPVDRDATGILGQVPLKPRALLWVAAPGQSGAATVSLELGQAVDLPGGGKARFVGITNWVRIAVANDWSVPYIYLLGMLACVGLTIALLAPPRGARFLVVETKSGPALHVASWHARGDPAFAERVRSIANQAAGAESADETDTGGEA